MANITTPLSIDSNYAQTLGNGVWQSTTILDESTADKTSPNYKLAAAVGGSIDWMQEGKNMAANQTGVPDIPQKPVDGVRNDATNTEKERIASQKTSQEFTREDSFSIGTVYLNIPPTQISISEEKHNFRFKTLRGGSDIVATSGRSTVRIDLDIVFNGIGDINNKLRPLLAQFKCTPFLPINNDYLRSIIEPDSADTEEEPSVSEVDNINSIQSNKASSISSLVSQVQSLQSMGAISDLQAGQVINMINQWYGAGNSLALSGASQYTATSSTSGGSFFNVKDYIYSLVTSSGKVVPPDQVINLSTTMSNIEAINNNINNYMSQSADVVSDNVNKRYISRQIVGALSQFAISTIPGYPEALSARISMYVFNYYPYSFDFSFIKGYSPNQYTPDITQCELFIDWYSNRFLSKMGQGSALGVYSGDDSALFTYIDKLSYEQLITNNPAGVSPKRVSIDGNGSYITGISVIMRNVIKFIPILVVT